MVYFGRGLCWCAEELLTAMFAAKIICPAIALSLERGSFVYFHPADRVVGHTFLFGGNLRPRAIDRRFHSLLYGQQKAVSTRTKGEISSGVSPYHFVSPLQGCGFLGAIYTQGVAR